MIDARTAAGRLLVYVLPLLEEANRNATNGPTPRVKLTKRALTRVFGYEPSSDELLDAISVTQRPWSWVPGNRKRPRATGGGLIFWEVSTRKTIWLKVYGRTDDMLMPLVALGFIS